jgi:ATP-dependent protease HslVU (ClpYQ) peptidase subunit
MGPNCLKSAPKGSGRAYLRHLNDGRVGRRNRRVTVRLLSVRPLRAPACLIRLTAHIVAPSRVSPSSDTPLTGRLSSMTTIAALEGIDYAVLVADSQITEDNLVTLATSTPKIVEVGKYLIGLSGDTRPGDILSYNWKPPLYKGEDPAQFMGKRIIPSIIQAFTDNNYEYNKVDKDDGFDYLIAFNGNIFRIACDLSFFQANHGAYGIGSGGQLALGYLYSIVKPDMDLAYSKRHARRAVEIASVLDANTNKPLQLVVQERF